MTKEALIEELRNLSPEDRGEIFQAAFAPTDEDYELTDKEKTLIDRRRKEMREHPERNLTLEEFRESLHRPTTA